MWTVKFFGKTKLVGPCLYQTEIGRLGNFSSWLFLIKDVFALNLVNIGWQRPLGSHTIVRIVRYKTSSEAK